MVIINNVWLHSFEVTPNPGSSTPRSIFIALYFSPKVVFLFKVRYSILVLGNLQESSDSFRHVGERTRIFDLEISS